MAIFGETGFEMAKSWKGPFIWHGKKN